eukprot:gnl/TRDRNA2_/TRDRNA2_136829_c2_seq1.p1 gnl/TRDRNA2_/TRDRNA2_136829_c2~~gnl/TRDRNA2_/TRDRNA2_136829_c2_seq1.p1  ORF type:complete len:174 (-),score=25.37 gnl/TRDRNA2_/TRDRNA2_136829_c2_seq1:3-524(-)
MAYEGEVKSFFPASRYGFITWEGKDIFYHIKQCGEFPPQKGDIVKFDLAPCDQKPGEQMAVNVTGGTGGAWLGERWVGLNIGGEPNIGKIGDGAYRGTVKSFSKFGWGFITEAITGTEYFVHINDCISRPVVGDQVAFNVAPCGGKRPNDTKAIDVSGGTAPLDDGKGKGKGK